MRHLLMAFFLLPFGAFCTAAQQACTDAVSCNGVGTAAYQAGRSAEALQAFVRQLGFAEDADDSKAQELALNNLMLASLKAGQNGMARAWMQRALRAGFEGEATRFNLAKVAAAVDYAALQASAEGRYLRYAGQGGWSVIEVRRQGDGYRLQFYPIRVGRGPLDDYGPAAIGELSGRLEGQGPYWTVRDTGLAEGCTLGVLRESLDLRVLEVFGERCQDYGGAGISVAGEYLKVDNRLAD